MPMEEPMEADVKEADEEVDVGEAPPTGDLAPEQAPAPRVTLPAAAGFWVGSPSDQVAGRELAASSRARVRHPLYR